VNQGGYARFVLADARLRRPRPIDVGPDRLDAETTTPEPSSQLEEVAAGSTTDVQDPVSWPHPQACHDLEEEVRAARAQALVEERPDLFFGQPDVAVEVLE